MTAARWLGTMLQVTGSLMLAANASWSGWAYPLLLMGSLTWLVVADDAALAVLNIGFSAINLIGFWRWLL